MSGGGRGSPPTNSCFHLTSFPLKPKVSKSPVESVNIWNQPVRFGDLFLRSAGVAEAGVVRRGCRGHRLGDGNCARWRCNGTQLDSMSKLFVSVLNAVEAIRHWERRTDEASGVITVGEDINKVWTITELLVSIVYLQPKEPPRVTSLPLQLYFRKWWCSPSQEERGISKGKMVSSFLWITDHNHLKC